MHIAIMEDPSITEMLSSALIKQGHTVQSFPTALPCIEACSSSDTEISLLITEVRLPWSAIDGIDTIRLIQLQRPAFPSLIISTFSLAQLTLMCSDLNNITLLPKPFSLTQLLHKLQRITPSVSLMPP